MNWFEALLLGIIQGLTEFLPVSSSGHLEIGKVLLGLEGTDSLAFTVAVHGATVLSTIVVFRQDLWQLLRGSMRLQWNEETRYLALLAVSMLPVLFIGIFYKDEVESFFTGRVRFVGMMLMITALLLLFASYAPNRGRRIGFADALLIGLAQAVAVLPGISRSGATISTGLILGKDRASVARFSFLMVLVPIIGANILDLRDAAQAPAGSGVPVMALLTGFIAAFLTGWLACRWMIRLVQHGKLQYFALYCALIGGLALLLA
ncbi:MAG TPA: undecaprenyl-diphosphate phosphatase [Bacteroidales bacterium]|nr:undecaprenyl-diphosphate phosphatase [Bacteroidales bacterium]